MKILMACGGTGGHLFPGMALAEVFEERVKGVEIVMVGTPRGLEKEIIKKTHWRLEMISSVSLADKNIFGKFFALFGLSLSFFQACRLIRQERPDMVVGVGGYAAGPVLMMAALMRKPTLAVEPNATPGLSNRLLRFFVDRVVVAHEGMEKYFGKKTRLLGVPVRKSILTSTHQHISTSAHRKTIFIFGGSQGAKKINEGVLSALPHLKDLKDKIHFVHQVGRLFPVAAAEKIYRDNGFSAEVYPFIEKMGEFYGKADFVIARSGANAVAELVALGKPSLLIPYPFSAGNHQEANARALEKEGAAFVLLDREINGEKIAEAIRKGMEDPTLWETMGKKLAKRGGTQAAEKIVDECLQMVGYV